MTNPKGEAPPGSRGGTGAPAGAEEALLAARSAKADAIRARGENPFANDLAPSPVVALGELRARFESAHLPDGKYDTAKVGEISQGAPVHVTGRVVAMRGFGKASFLRLRDRQGEIQLFCRSDSLGASFARLEEIEVADFVEAEGVPMVTQKGELS